MINLNDIVNGVVTAIKPYGFFVKLNEEVSCLVHISQITDDFVADINDYVAVDQEVEVKIIEIKDGKYSGSLKF